MSSVTAQLTFIEPQLASPVEHPPEGKYWIALAGDERAEFFPELERLATSWAKFQSARMNDVKWCQPDLTVRVKHLAGSKRYATPR
jgi:hypothetical protein